MDEVLLKPTSSREKQEENLKNELDNIYNLNPDKESPSNEGDERNNFQSYISQQTKLIKSSLTKIIIFLTIFTLIEFIGSITSNSVGVLTIAAELFTDLIKSIITIISILIIEKIIICKLSICLGILIISIESATIQIDKTRTTNVEHKEAIISLR